MGASVHCFALDGWVCGYNGVKRLWSVMSPSVNLVQRCPLQWRESLRASSSQCTKKQFQNIQARKLPPSTSPSKPELATLAAAPSVPTPTSISHSFVLIGWITLGLRHACCKTSKYPKTHNVNGLTHLKNNWFRVDLLAGSIFIEPNN